MMTWMACLRVMSPELTKPTTMTVVAEDDWMTAVTPRPGQKARELASGELPEQRLELPACALFERCAHDVHAEQKQAQAPIKFRTSNKLSIIPSSFSYVILILYLQKESYRCFVKFASQPM